MKTKVNKDTSRRQIPDGIYPARFQGREDLEELGMGPIIRWNFEVDYEGDIYDLSGISSKKFTVHPNCKGWAWARAIDPTLTVEDEEWDDERAIGNPVMVEVKNKESVNGLIFSNVVGVLAVEEKAKGKKK